MPPFLARMGPMSGAQPPPVGRRVLRIASSCTSRDAFVAVFGRYCDGEFIFVATHSPRQIGEELNFRITLASGEVVIAASGRVEACYGEGEGPYGRAGLLLRFYDIDRASRPLVLELAAVPNAGFARRDERDGLESGGEGDSETRPAGLPRAVASRASSARMSSSQVSVPRPPPLAVKPDATPPPELGERATTRAGDDEGPTGVKSMESLVSRPDRGRSRDFADELGWDERSDVFGEGRRGRMALRTDLSGPHEPRDPSRESIDQDPSSSEQPVECAVFEESGPSEPSPPAPEPVGLPAAIRARASRPHDVWDDETIPPWLRGPQPDDGFDVPTGTHEPDRLAQRISDDVTEPAAPRDRQADEAPRASAVSRAIPIERDSVPPPSGEPVRGHSLPETYDVAAMIPRRRWPLALVSSAVSGIVGLAAGYAIGSGAASSSGEGERPGAASDVAGASAKAIAAAEGPGEAQPDEPDASGELAAAVIDENSEVSGEAEDEADAGERPARERSAADERRSRRAVERALRRDGCAVDVRSDPDGADIQVAGQAMGSTPTRFELPCGSHEIEVRRSRYAGAVRKVRLRPGKLDRVEVRLSRPDHKLRIVSAPVGATVTVNGKQVGTTPVVATVKGYQHIRVRIERPGFAPWSRKLYAREPLTRLSVKLTPETGSASGTPAPAESQAQRSPAAAGSGPATPTPSLASPGSEAKGR
jgi:PEGA domain